MQKCHGNDLKVSRKFFITATFLRCRARISEPSRAEISAIGG